MLKNKISARASLILSVAVICIYWLIVVVYKISNLDKSLNADLSVMKLFIHTIESAPILAATVFLLLWLCGERIHDIGFRSKNLIKQLLNGCVAGILIFLTVNFVIQTLLNALIHQNLPKGMNTASLFQDINLLPLWIFIAIIGGGFKEELERVFILTRFEKLLGKAGLTGALLLGSVIFGMGHLYQGYQGVILTSFTGFFFGLTYLRRRSAIEAVTAHAFYDIIGIVLAYVIYSR